MNIIVLCVLACVFPSFVLATVYKNCGSKNLSEIKSVEILGCPDDNKVCVIKRGTKASLRLEFVPKVDTDTLQLTMFGVVSEELEMNFEVSEPDICKIGIDCPVKAGQDYTFFDELKIGDNFMEIQLPVRIAFVSDKGKDLVCIEVLIAVEEEEKKELR